MKKIKSLKRWAICQLNKREVAEYGFQFAVIHPDNAESLYACTPADTDWECDTLEAAISWIENYDRPVDDTPYVYKVTDAAQGWVVGLANTAEEAIALHDAHCTGCSDACIWDANHNDVTDELLFGDLAEAVEEELAMIEANEEACNAAAINVIVTGSTYSPSYAAYCKTFSVADAAGIYDLIERLTREGVSIDTVRDTDNSLCYMTEAQVQAAGITEFTKPGKDIWCYRSEGCFYHLDHIMKA